MPEILPCVTGVLLSIGIIVIIRSRYNKDDWPTDLIVYYISQVVYITYAWTVPHQYLKEYDKFWKAASGIKLNKKMQFIFLFSIQFRYV